MATLLMTISVLDSCCINRSINTNISDWYTSSILISTVPLSIHFMEQIKVEWYVFELCLKMYASMIPPWAVLGKIACINRIVRVPQRQKNLRYCNNSNIKQMLNASNTLKFSLFEDFKANNKGFCFGHLRTPIVLKKFCHRSLPSAADVR